MKRGGFTLVELMLATMLVSVVSAFAFLTFRSVSRGWQISCDYVDKMQRTDYAINQVISALRSMYYTHDGSQSENYGFQLEDRGEGKDPDDSDLITWSKKGSALIGGANDVASSVHRVQLMILEEGNRDYREEVQKTGLYARLMRDVSLIPKDDSDDTEYGFGNSDLYQPILVADGIVGFNCRVIPTQDALNGSTSVRNSSENDKKLFEDEFAASNSVPYKVELTFRIADPDGRAYRSNTAPLVRIVRIPIHEQSSDGAAPPEEAGDSKSGGKKE